MEGKMTVGEPIGGVGVGLGKPPSPSASAFNGTGGTAVVYHDASEYGSLMALRGQILAEWSVAYPPGPLCESTDKDHKDWIAKQAGSTSVKFLRAKIVRVSHVGGAVEVTLNYGAVQRLPLGGNVLPSTGGPLAQKEQVKGTRSNIKNN
jgi:hypothetical protein